eukprot:SAG31_NODE_1617_length_7733_cov_6.446817_9_plen_60_part_00
MRLQLVARPVRQLRAAALNRFVVLGEGNLYLLLSVQPYSGTYVDRYLNLVRTKASKGKF